MDSFERLQAIKELSRELKEQVALIHLGIKRLDDLLLSQIKGIEDEGAQMFIEQKEKLEEDSARLKSVDELAKFLGVKKQKIYGMTMRKGPGSIPRYNVGRYLRFDFNEIMEWLREKRTRRLSDMTDILDRIVTAIGDKNFIDLRIPLESLFKSKDISFTYEPVVAYMIKHKGRTIVITNKKNVDKAERTVGEIAIGYLG